MAIFGMFVCESEKCLGVVYDYDPKENIVFILGDDNKKYAGKGFKLELTMKGMESQLMQDVARLRRETAKSINKFHSKKLIEESWIGQRCIFRYDEGAAKVGKRVVTEVKLLGNKTKPALRILAKRNLDWDQVQRENFEADIRGDQLRAELCAMRLENIRKGLRKPQAKKFTQDDIASAVQKAVEETLRAAELSKKLDNLEVMDGKKPQPTA